MTSASLKKLWLTRCLAPGRRHRAVIRFRPRVEVLDERTVPALMVAPTGITVTLDETAGLQNDDTTATLPAAFSSRLTTLGAAPATAINAAVSSGNVISLSGISGTITNLAFTDASGTALAGASSGLSTAAGEAIYLYTDAANDNILLGRTAGMDTVRGTADDVIAVAVYLEETGSPVSGGKFWSIAYKPLRHPDAANPDDSLTLPENVKVSVTQDINFGFAGAPSGSNLFMTFGDPASTQIVVIGKNPLNQSEGGLISSKDVLNISQAGSTTSFGVNGNQINPAQGAFITYVSGTDPNLLVPNLDQNEADVEANIAFQNVVSASAASFTVNQTNPGVGPVTVRITAFNTAAEPGVNFVDGLTNDTRVNITSASVVNVVVKKGNVQYTPVATVNADGTLTVTGLSSGDQVRWTTGGTHNRVLIENFSHADGVSGNDNNTFDIGGFGISTPNATSAVVGTAVHFEDDGPGVTAGGAVPTLVTDDTEAPDADAKSFAGVFTPAFGADGPAATGAVTYALGVKSAGADSGLDDALTGDNILLRLTGAVVEGYLANNPGVLAFTVSVGAGGLVTQTQLRAVVHNDPADLVESGASAARLAAADLVTLTATVKDGDGDTRSASANVGQAFTFEDDGPSVTASITGAPTLTVDESNPATNASGGFAAQFAKNFGADGPGATPVGYALSTPGGASGLTDTATGESVVLSLVNGQVVGKTASTGLTVFVVSIDGSGVVTLDQQRAVVHADASNPDDARTLAAANLVVLTATVVDGDGDWVSAPLDIGLQLTFKDDGPTAARNATPVPTLTVDETDFATDASASFAGLFSTAFGTDGFKNSDNIPVEDPDAVTFALGVKAPGVASGLIDARSNQSVVLNLAGGVVIGTAGAGGPEVFRVSVNADTGVVTLNQSRAVAHDGPTDPDESTSPAGLSAADLVSLTATTTDGDGDTATATADIGGAFKFEDDGPSVTLALNGTPTVRVDETTLGTPASAPAATLFTTTADFGADGAAAAGSSVWSLVVGADGTDSGLDDATGGANVLLFQSGPGSVVGKVGSALGAVAFTVSVDAATGAVTLSQARALKHPDATNPDDEVGMASGLISVRRTVTDADGDQDAKSTSISQVLRFKDDGPAITVDNSSGTFSAGAQGVWAPAPGSDGFQSLSLTLNGYAIDGGAAVTVTTPLGTATATDANGNYVFTGSITADFTDDGIANNQTVSYKLTFNPSSGSYTLQLTTPPSTVSTFDTTQGSLAAGGPDAVQTLLFGGSAAGADDVVFFGAVATAPMTGGAGASPNDLLDLVGSGEADLTESQIEALFPVPNLVNASTQMNVSTAGIGINNNNLNGAAEGSGTGAFAGTSITAGDESFVVNPETVVDAVTVYIDNSVGGYTPATEDLYYTVYYTDGAVSAPIKVTAAMLTPVTSGVASGGVSFTIGGGNKRIDAVQLTMGQGTVKIPVIQFTVEQVFTPQSLALNFTATIADKDGDTRQDTFAVTLS